MRDRGVEVMLTLSERRDLRRAAAARGETLAGWIRRTMLALVREEQQRKSA